MRSSYPISPDPVWEPAVHLRTMRISACKFKMLSIVPLGVTLVAVAICRVAAATEVSFSKAAEGQGLNSTHFRIFKKLYRKAFKKFY